MVATMVATLDISKPVDADGQPIEQPIVFSTGLSSHPGKFDVSFRARSKEAAELLSQAVGDAE